MKKNFLMVAALLIAAMLMVVSCTQEVAPKNELVKASFSVGFGKDITIKDYEGTGIKYEYSLEPLWDKLSTGAEIIGEVTNEPIADTKSIAQRITGQRIGYVTPGLWKVTVNGYSGYTDAGHKGTLVVTGETNTYFIKGKTNATVLVYPVQTGNATLHLELEMQDLKDNNEIHVDVLKLDGKNLVDTIVLKADAADVTVSNVSGANGNAAYKYVKNVDLTEVGFFTIKVTVPNYDGGYVRTFLAINGDTINVTGSVYPSQFIDSNLSIISVSVDNANLTIEGTKDTNNYYSGEITFTLNDDDNTYLDNIDDTEIGSLTTSYGVSRVSVAKDYSWYINEKQVKGEGISNETKEIKKTFAPGVYSVSCVITYSVTFDYATGDDVTKVFKGDAHTAEFIVK